jgi:PAS domain-containing protein
MSQRPIELIHARNLMSSISTPAFLVDADANLVYYNEAAGSLFGRRFEETGPLPANRWGPEFGPVDRGGESLPINELPLTATLRRGRPAHARFCIHDHAGDPHDIDLSAMPIVGSDGFRGAIAFFWRVADDEGEPS